MVFCNCLWLVGCCVVKYLPKVPFEKWPQTPSLAGADGGVQMISRPRISGNWPPTVVGIGSDIRFDLKAAPEFVCGRRIVHKKIFYFYLSLAYRRERSLNVVHVQFLSIVFHSDQESKTFIFGIKDQHVKTILAL